MQFLPATAVSDTDPAATSANARQGQGFDMFGGVLSSFIEEDRFDYSGRPPGFAAYGPKLGTLDFEDGSRIAEELRKRNVSELSVGHLELLNASGSSMTIGKVFTALTGKSRLTDGLSDEENTQFKKALDKLGFSEKEREEMVGLSYDGDYSGMWKLLGDKLAAMDTPADLDGKEWNGLLRGLDISAKNRKALRRLFGEDVREVVGKDLEEFLSAVKGEYAERDKAAAQAREHMRDAVIASLESAKLDRINASVESTRGSRLQEQKEALMNNSVRKNTGIDQLKADGEIEEGEGLGGRHGDSGFEDHAFDGRRGDQGGSRSERILATGATLSDAPARKSADAEKNRPTSQTTKLLETFTIAPESGRAELNTASQAQNLNSMAKSYSREIFAQVEQGILSGTQNNMSRLTLQLNPVELGQVTVMLSVHQGEVKATIRAENQESAAILREQMAELKTALEAEGLKVKDLDVQTALRDDSSNQWEGPGEHNLLRDAEERTRMMRLARIRRETAGEGERLETAAPVKDHNGLHIVA